MPAQPSTKKIGQYTFTFSPLLAWENFHGFHDLLRVLGPSAPAAVRGIVAAFSKGKSLTKEELLPLVLSLAGTLPQTLASAPYEDFEALSKRILQNVVMVEAKGAAKVLDVIDTKLQGELGVMLELISWCVWEAYGSFFVDSATKLGEAFAAKKNAETSPKAAPSQSTSQTS